MVINGVFEDLFLIFYPEITDRKMNKKGQKTVPEAFPEYPEITIKPVSGPDSLWCLAQGFSFTNIFSKNSPKCIGVVFPNFGVFPRFDL